jgi:formate-dependent nitrite reductase membrane component NrfD
MPVMVSPVPPIGSNSGTHGSLISASKLHPLWHTPLLPLLFLGSCLFMGYAVVVFEGELSSEVFRRPRETRMLVSLSWVMVDVLFVFLALRLGDLASRGRLGLLLNFDLHTFFFLLEMALFLAPAILMMKTLEGQKAAAKIIWGQDAGFEAPEFTATLGERVVGVLTRTVFAAKVAEVKKFLLRSRGPRERPSRPLSRSSNLLGMRFIWM